jgi:hypothetical protein
MSISISRCPGQAKLVGGTHQRIDDSGFTDGMAGIGNDV